MNNPEKLTALGTHDEDKQNKNRNTMCVGHHYAQANTNNVKKTSHKQLEVKTNRTSFFAEVVMDITTRKIPRDYRM
jgi:hypothetical protein